MEAISPAQKAHETYTFSSQPKAINKEHKKYRDPYQSGKKDEEEENKIINGNIMYDRRVIRGNTYAIRHLPAKPLDDSMSIQRKREMKRRAKAKKLAKKKLQMESPEPVEGRKNIEIQTELYLEEITDYIEEVHEEIQTDAFLDRPASPLFQPCKTGQDASTQIVEGDLFDFHLEVKEIIDVLVGKTIEQSLLETLEETELMSLRRHQRHYENLRQIELVEQQRLEELDRRIKEEKESRIRHLKHVLKLENKTKEKISAQLFAKAYLTDLIPNVFQTLAESGYFNDPISSEIETQFLPGLMADSIETIESNRKARRFLDNLICKIVYDLDGEYESLFKTKEEEFLKALKLVKETDERKEKGSRITSLDEGAGVGGDNDEEKEVFQEEEEEEKDEDEVEDE